MNEAITIEILLIVFLSLLVGGISLAFYRSQRNARRIQSELKSRLQSVESAVTRSNQRSAAVLRISHKFVSASDENEIVEYVLRFSMELTEAMGASFVPLDDRGHPLAAIRQGDFPFPLPDAWLEYLASPSVRQECNHCSHKGSYVRTCPLLKGPLSDAVGLYCMPLRRGDRELGILNLYMPNSGQMDLETSSFLQSILDATALAIEGERLRRRELTTLSQLRSTRQRADLQVTMVGIVESIWLALQADFALLVRMEPTPPKQDGNLRQPVQYQEGNWIEVGDFQEDDRSQVQSVIAELSGARFDLDHLPTAKLFSTPSGPSILMAVPVLLQDHSLEGVLILGSRNSETFHARQLELLQTVAGQLAAAIQNGNQLADLEFKTLMGERSRLAREIHDGVAQTLGFLKLQIAQLQGLVEREEFERVRILARTSYDALSDAYYDVREAIDMLRANPLQGGDYRLADWLHQMALEFEDFTNSSFSVEVTGEEIHRDLPPEVHAQLIRIVQEALSNIRKHARASRVWISCQEINGDLLLEVRDDGQGFCAEDVPGPSQHGLRGMQERAELLGADFQIISRQDEGTTVRVCLPLEASYPMET